MMDRGKLKELLLASLDRRYRSHAARDLTDYLLANDLFQTVEAEMIDFVYTYKDDLPDYLSDPNHRAELVKYCIEATQRYTYQRNQFINYPPAYDRLLDAEYDDFLRQIGLAVSQAVSPEALTLAFSTLLKRHHERLRLILSSYCLSFYNSSLHENPLLRSVPCEEYTARFQLGLLHLDLAQVREPILDIGCGTSGTLVNYLREQGYSAFGLDRLAPPGPHFFRQNWFEFAYESRTWGTVIAHQSLSTHFIYNHLHNQAKAEPYAGLLMRIIASLAPDGAFYYTPGLPFFEDTLEKIPAYSVDRKTIPGNNMPGIGEIFYSSRIRKLSNAYSNHL